MSTYYAKVKTGVSNISLKNDVYQQKGINLDVDKTSDFHLSPYTAGGGGAANTYGSHLGREVNPWWSEQIGAGTDRTGGMAQFNSPEGYLASSTYIHPVSLGTLAQMEKWYFPLNPFTQMDDSLFDTGQTLHDGALNPAWNQNFHYNIFFYTARRTQNNGVPVSGMNWITSVRRSNGQVRVSVGSMVMDPQGGISQFTNDANVNYTSIFSQIAPLNVGQGHGTPYNANSDLGSSTQIGTIYRNSSGQERYRIITVNTGINTSGTATISLGAEQSFPSVFGSSVFTHGAVNMGKGTMWAPYHRGANYARIAWLNWSSGTTATRGQYFASSISATDTINPGDIVKASDELAFWFYPRRNGASSGNSRAISVSVFQTNGANKEPLLRGAWNLATYDFGATQNAGCNAAVGGSTNADYLTGIVVYARADTRKAYILPWHYRIGTNTFTFVSNRILIVDAQQDSYRVANSVVHIGTSRDGTQNYYEVSISGNSGTFVYGITANSDIAGGDYTLTQSSFYNGGSTFGTNVQRSVAVKWAPGGKNEQMMWFDNSVPTNYASGRVLKTVHLYTDTNLTFKIGTHLYRFL
jgi:hypothetical protein